MPIYRRVLRYYRPFVPQTLAGLLLTLCAIGLNLLKPWPLKIIVDDLIPLAKGGGAHADGWRALISANPTRALLVLCATLVLIQLLWGLLNRTTNFLFVRVGLQALLKLRTELYAYLQSLSLKYHDAQRSSDSSFRVAYDSQAIQAMYNQGFTNIFTSSVTLIGTFIVMVRIDWQLTLLSLGVVPLIVGAIYYFAQRIRKQSTLI
nr:hypothetical protein [Chthoniobacterales bacterium]